jgi:hypothetical protein
MKEDPAIVRLVVEAMNEWDDEIDQGDTVEEDAVNIIRVFRAHGLIIVRTS